jgi:hypothetical protein
MLDTTNICYLNLLLSTLEIAIVKENWDACAIA